MNLTKIEVSSLPGIETPFCLNNLSEGVNIIWGPNGSGKSSLVRGLRSLLWPTGNEPERMRLMADFKNPETRAQLDGIVKWRTGDQEVKAPSLPEKHLAPCFTLNLRDLLLSKSNSDQRLAEMIRVQMAGGYDLHSVKQYFSVTPLHGRHEKNELMGAEKRLDSLKLKRSSLGVQEDSLEKLKSQLQEAREASKEHQVLELALEFLQKKQDLAGAEARMAEFPKQMGLLHGNENQSLSSFKNDIDLAQSEISRRQKKKEEAEKTVQSLGPRMDLKEISAWLKRAHEAERLYERVKALKEKAHGSVERRRIAGESLGDPELQSIDPKALEKSEEHLLFASRLSQKRAAIEEQIKLLGPVTEPQDQQMRGLNESMGRLRKWLLVPSPKIRPHLLGPGAILFLGLAFFVNPWCSLGAGLCLGGLVYQWVMKSLFDKERARLENEFKESGQETLDFWTYDKAISRLNDLEASLRRLEKDRENAALYDRLSKELNSLEDEEKALTRKREGLIKSLGLDPQASGLLASDLAQRVLIWRKAYLQSQEDLSLFQDGEQAYNQKFNALADFIEKCGAQRPVDCLEAHALLTDLDQRDKTLRNALKDQASAEEEIQSRSQDIKRKRDQIHLLFRTAGIETSDPEQAEKILKQRLKQLPEFTKENQNLNRLKRENAELRARLNKREDLIRQSLAQIEDAMERAKERQSRLEELAAAIKGIEKDVEAACSSGELEQAMADRDKQKEILSNKLHMAHRATAALCLLEGVEREYEQKSRPKVLKKAQDLFLSFTQYVYKLRIRVEGEMAIFKALDVRTNQTLDLDELSDGTRVQLLLAARLAFAFFVERGEKPPLFLDEALTTADPLRFSAIIKSLLILAGRGRQIFYLTCNPSDVTLIQRICEEANAPPPKKINLEQIREMAGSETNIRVLAPTPLPDIPPPEGKTPEEYAKEIGIKKPDPFAPADSLPLFYLLRNQLDLLHLLLSKTWISTLGQWRHLFHTKAYEIVINQKEARKLNGAISVVQPFLEAWRIGRGFPINKRALESSGAVTPKFLNKLYSLSEELDHSGQALIRALESGGDERIKNFRSNKTRELAAYFQDKGFIDGREMLPKEKVLAIVLNNSEVKRNLQNQSLTLDTVQGIVHDLWITFNASEKQA